MNRGICFAALFLLLQTTNGQAQTVTAVADFDLSRYVGSWYEIARLPNKFQKQCVADVSATYVKRTDGDIDVINRCKNAAGTIEEAVGQGRVPEPGTKAKLKVRFAPRWLSWLPMVWADYWVLDIAPDYSVAAVGDPTKKYLWILARKKEIADPVYQALMKRLTSQGFDTSQLVLTRHDDSK
ncbi:lipocalin family protein [Actimicrobium sp. CCC2.4]|uniref:lipocalin family protein n=1 Tax=Actimicrobium sp. CCC2.4 TaxID=3048606 RepID=UPI002AC8954A|nr:lipocalin family protein [Actimicrobium sp. CCC2.4]MEB0135909.1 lipocalin family protein [Actimicrobium sp. CCC2.4]WPX32576.1 lipocalin family protein [Actimicrobium sp. CCC2.4]